MFFTEPMNLNNQGSNGLDAVIERYVGRRPEIIKIEAELTKLHTKIKENSFSLLNGDLKAQDIRMKEINESKENQNIERLFKKLFGLKEVDLYWVKTSLPNASTACKTMQVLDKGFKVDKRTGVDVNNNLTVHVMVNTGLITLSKMTPGEVLAIILHEFGHNFYQSALQVISRFDPFMPHSMIQSILLTDIIDVRKPLLRMISIKDIIVDMLRLNRVKTIIEEVMVIQHVYSLHSLKLFIGLFTGALYFKDEFYIRNALSPRVYTLYAVEKHADSFAIDYGYGVELASALNKLDQRVDNAAYDIPVFGQIKDFEALLVGITFQTLSGYPTMHNRQVSALKRLKKAQNDPALPPRLRKELDRQVKDMEAYYENYMSFNNKENQKRIFTWLYRKILDTFFDGIVDMRELIHKLDGAYKEDWTDIEK